MGLFVMARQTINAAPETIELLRELADLLQDEQRRLKPPSAGEVVHIALLEALEQRRGKAAQINHTDQA